MFIISATVDAQILCNNIADIDTAVALAGPHQSDARGPSIDRLRSACAELRAVYANENRHPSLPPRETIFTLANLMTLAELMVSGTLEGDEINIMMLKRVSIRARRMIDTVTAAVEKATSINSSTGESDANEATRDSKELAKLNRAGTAFVTLATEIDRAIAVYERHR